MTTPLANRKTRLTLVTVLELFVTGLLVSGLFFSVENAPTFDQWADFTFGMFGIYATSEVGAKGAEAYRDKGRV